MQNKKTSLLLMAALLLPYMAFVTCLALRPDQIRVLPRWVFGIAALYWLAVAVAFPLLKRLLNSRTTTPSDQALQGVLLAALGRSRVKRMFFFYVWSFFGGIIFTILGVIPMPYAIGGIVLVLAFAVFYGWLLFFSHEGPDNAKHAEKR